MSSPQKAKGKSYERDCAKNLSDVFGLNFIRVPNSGAYIGNSNSFRNETLTAEQQLLMDGDLIVPKELSNFSFECKFHKDIGKISSWFDGNAKLTDWISQASHTSKKFWLLMFKINNMGEFLVFDPSLLSTLKIPPNWLKYQNICIIRLNWEPDGFFYVNKDEILKIGLNI